MHRNARVSSALRVPRRSKRRTDHRSDQHADHNTDPDRETAPDYGADDDADHDADPDWEPHQLHIVHNALPTVAKPRFLVSEYAKYGEES
jgi:hypothetical protein